MSISIAKKSDVVDLINQNFYYDDTTSYEDLLDIVVKRGTALGVLDQANIGLMKHFGMPHIKATSSITIKGQDMIEDMAQAGITAAQEHCSAMRWSVGPATAAVSGASSAMAQAPAPASGAGVGTLTPSADQKQVIDALSAMKWEADPSGDGVRSSGRRGNAALQPHKIEQRLSDPAKRLFARVNPDDVALLPGSGRQPDELHVKAKAVAELEKYKGMDFGLALGAAKQQQTALPDDEARQLVEELAQFGFSLKGTAYTLNYDFSSRETAQTYSDTTIKPLGVTLPDDHIVERDGKFNIQLGLVGIDELRQKATDLGMAQEARQLTQATTLPSRSV
jgi:hypothetical protein